MPDYEIKECNEDYFDINYNAFTKEAYFAKKYAFVSDVARLYALVQDGGVYFDTDIKVLKPIDEEYLSNKAFIGFERDDLLSTAMLASEPRHPAFEAFLRSYNNIHFFLFYKFNSIPNTCRLTNFLIKKGLNLNDEFQCISDIAIFPKEYFCAKDYRSGKLHITDKTFLIHDFSGSWTSTKSSKLEKRKMEVSTIIKYIINKSNVKF